MTERWQRHGRKGAQAAGGPIPFAPSQPTFLFPRFLAARRAPSFGPQVTDAICRVGVQGKESVVPGEAWRTPARTFERCPPSFTYRRVRHLLTPRLRLYGDGERR